jgi:hypothetical protein
MTDRPTDHAWEALVAATNTNVNEERGALNRALSQIKAMTVDLDLSNEELGSVISYRAGLYREIWPQMTLTALALAKHWDRLPVEHERLTQVAERVQEEEAQKRRTRGVNLHADSGCTTCLGQHYVIVGYREPRPTQWMLDHGIKHVQHPKDRGHEEVAPCPLCNDRGGWWLGRTWSYSSEPGELVLGV